MNKRIRHVPKGLKIGLGDRGKRSGCGSVSGSLSGSLAGGPAEEEEAIIRFPSTGVVTQGRFNYQGGVWALLTVTPSH
ncbi:hypothetical protein E2C01_090555 [Portunus trituberculatus]|uniref:Uncharacterized protein n=1 Tax=Portunus trituberculatus TaxID=210409 RepID=A0A5B7JQN6_PORTR|nr:hypothetical protein [Portunus trituberculatus]